MVERFSTTFKLPPLIDCDLDFNEVLSLGKNNNNNNSRGFFFPVHFQVSLIISNHPSSLYYFIKLVWIKIYLDLHWNLHSLNPIFEFNKFDICFFFKTYCISLGGPWPKLIANSRKSGPSPFKTESGPISSLVSSLEAPEVKSVRTYKN